MRHRLLASSGLSLLFAGMVAAQAGPVGTPAAAVVAAAGKQMQIFDLSEQLDESATFYPAMFAGMRAETLPEQPRAALQFGRKVFSGGTPFALDPAAGKQVPSFMTGEHTGTHMDAPNHFIQKAGDVASHPLGSLARPLVVIDIRDAARGNNKFAVTVDVLLAWESTNGRIPDGAIVCLATGCEHKIGGGETPHPGFHRDAAEWMRRERNVAGVGSDALSPDVAALMQFPVHKRLLQDNCIILENMRNLGSVPPNGAFVVMGPMPITDGSGSPTRVLALVGTPQPGDYDTLDLTYRLDAQTPFVAGRDPVFQPPEKPLLGGLAKELGKGLKLPKIDLPKLDLGGETKPVLRETTARVMIQGYYGGYFEMGISTGTHVRFPRQNSYDGSDAASYTLGRLFGRAVVVDLRDEQPGAAISAESLANRLGGVNLSGAFLILWTGRGTRGHPGVSADAASWAMNQSARGILTDAPEIDPSGSREVAAERVVHQASGITGGFMREPGRLPVSGATLAILPMPIVNAPAAPARILAYVPRR